MNMIILADFRDYFQDEACKNSADFTEIKFQGHDLIFNMEATENSLSTKIFRL